MSSTPDRNPWHDRFAEPTVADLADLYEPEIADVLTALRDLIAGRTGAQPAVEWRGIAWRWTLAYRRPGEDEPWAYVIPTADRPTISIPVPVDPLSSAQLRRAPRFIRDGLRTAPRIGQVCWLETRIETQGHVADLERFIAIVTEAQPV